MSPSNSLYTRLGGHAGILKLVRSFYTEVRRHSVLGPIFNTHIQDWDGHLVLITEFWALQTGGKSKYGGGFSTAHEKLGLRPEHFNDWLGLWAGNNARVLAAKEAAQMNRLARELAGRLLPLAQA